MYAFATLNNLDMGMVWLQRVFMRSKKACLVRIIGVSKVNQKNQKMSHVQPRLKVTASSERERDLRDDRAKLRAFARGVCRRQRFCGELNREVC